MAIREYECPADGPFEVIRSISAPTEETCPVCGAPAIKAPTRAATFGIAGVDGGIPGNSKDEVGYEQWQRETWTKWEDKLNVANAGEKPISRKKLLTRTESGKHRDL